MTTTPPRPRPSTTLRARSPEDLLALVPVVMGFWPEESIVLLTFGAARTFHARTDLPPVERQTPEVLDDLDELLLGPARHHGVRAVVLLYYAGQDGAVAAAHDVLRRGCERDGIEVLACLASDGERYRDLDRPTAAPTPYDVSAHPFVVEAIVSGRLRHRSREDLVTSLDPDPAAVARVEQAVLAAGFADAGVAVDGRSIRRQGGWVESLVAAAVATSRTPEDHEVARLAWQMQSVRVRDAAWSLIDRRNAQAHADWWTQVLRRVPPQLRAAPAGLLGWASWQAGDGARAWAAVDVCLAADPDYVMATYLGALLQQAVPPDSWDGGFDWTLGLPAAG